MQRSHYRISWSDRHLLAYRTDHHFSITLLGASFMVVDDPSLTLLCTWKATKWAQAVKDEEGRKRRTNDAGLPESNATPTKKGGTK